MDILTHVIIGATASSPWWASHPLESVAFTFGSILPDMDALSRQFGKVAFMRAHQGWTHSIPLQGLVGLAMLCLVLAGDLSVLAPSIVACMAGAMLHSGFDWTNTYGVRLWAPFDMRRRAGEWIFFIDAGVLGLSLPVLATQGWLSSSGAASQGLGLVWIAAMASYVATRGFLRRRAARLAPHAVALIPSALVPWRYHGLELSDRTARTFTLDAATGRRGAEAVHARHDHDWVERLRALPEYRAMADLSPGYCVFEGDEGVVECRDLRTRNSFGTNFGRLRVKTDGATLSVERFDV